MISYSLFKHKKGQLIQVAYFIVILFACALVILLMQRINSEFNTAVNESGMTYYPNNTNPTAVTDVAQSWITAYSNFDYGFVVLTIGLMCLLIFTSFWIPTHPIFIVINFVGIFFLVFLGMMMGNFYGSIVSGADQVLGTEASTYTLMNFVMSNLPYIAAAIIFICSIVMYIRGNSQGVGGQMG